jgi:hypothetical protein
VYLKQVSQPYAWGASTRLKALSLLRCANQDAGLVNGLAIFDNGDASSRQAICLANMDGLDGECITAVTSALMC